MGDENVENASDEDIPSDFFDDFNKEDFISGLSVVDSWDDDIRNKQIEEVESENVKDLQELLQEDEAMKNRIFRKLPKKYDRSKYTYVRKQESAKKDSKSSELKIESTLNEYIKPGSRRDPTKTQEAIKKDKEEKVKNYLAKHLDSSDDLKPPGTELDDFFDSKAEVHEEKKVHENTKKKRIKDNTEIPKSKYSRHSPRNRGRQSPKRSPRQSLRRSPLRRSPLRRSPLRRSPLRRSPLRSRHRSPHWSPRRSPFRLKKYGHDRRSPSVERRSPHISSRVSPHRPRYSRSPKRSHRPHNSRSRSPNKINFMFPAQAQPSFSGVAYHNVPLPHYSESTGIPFAAGAPGYTYTPDVPYSDVYSGSYNYGTQVIPPDANTAPASFVPQPVPVPQPVAAPVIQPLMDIPVMPPALVPQPIAKPDDTVTTSNNDALAKLVAEGKLSQEDYMKLAPNKNTNTPMDTKTRVAVLNRCYNAMGHLKKLTLPNQLIINNIIVGNDQKCIEPKYCSPLKRQARVEFELTKSGDVSTQQNKQLVDSIIASIGLEKIVVRPKKKTQKNLKDAATQTSRPFCDMCEIRDSMKLYDASTHIDFEYFNTAVHTQVVEQDLVSSKSLFNPSGSIGDSGPISIAHMTPAQLVSQLAARAKTLKQSEPSAASSGNVYGRRNPPNSYDPWGGNSYNNHNNYRY